MNDLICPTGGEIDNLDGFVKDGFFSVKEFSPILSFWRVVCY